MVYDAAIMLDPAIGLTAVASFALLFASAATHKLRDLRRFAEVFSAYGLLPPGSRPRLAWAVPLVELGVAVGLLAGTSRRYAGGVGVVLLIVYASAIAINLRRGRHDLACGCGGPDERRPIAAWMIWRNLILAALLGGAMVPWSARPLVVTDALTVGFGSAASALLYLCLDQLLGQLARRAVEMRGPR